MGKFNPMVISGGPGWEPCQAVVKKTGLPCKQYGEAWRGGFCHIHDPEGVFAQQHPKYQKRMRDTYKPMWTTGEC